MNKNKLISRFLTTTIIVGISASTALPAFAQEAGAEDEASESNSIVVTGSRLRVNPNLESAAPIISVSSEQIQARGTTRIEDLTNQLPQVFAAQAGEVSNSATGTAQLNLRGLGAERTLVLIDGRRLPYGSSVSSPANLDLIPTQLIEKIDIVTGGASAVYGSDAIGGVANFVLRRNFEGVEIDIQGGFQQTDNDNSFFRNVLERSGQPVPGSTVDGEEYSITGIIGTNTADGRGNVTIFANYEKRRAIVQRNRDFSACTIGESGREGISFGGAACAGSPNFRLFGSADSLVVDADGDPVQNVFQEEDGTIVPFEGLPQQTFNFGASNFFQRPSERYTLYGRAHYELTDNLELFADISYTDVISDAQIAETASFGLFFYSINCDNPFIQNTPGIALTEVYGCSQQDIANGTIVNGITASHRNVEGGPRNSRLENSAFRVLAGLRGDFADGVWSFEAFGQYSETSDTAISTNDFVVDRLQQAFFAVDDGNGNVVCIDPSRGCVPYNPFQRNADGSSAITQEQTDFIQGVGIVVGETTQRIVGANIQGDLGHYGVKSPFADDGVGLLIGIEHRRDTLDSIPDDISRIPGGGFTGVGGATLPVSGQIEVFEIFSELQVPIVQDRPFFHELTLAGQYRYSDYDASGNGTNGSFSTDAYGIQLTWAPVEDISIRAQYQRSVRAPNVIELYTGQDTDLPNLNAAGINANGVQVFDPCATSAPLATLEACMRTGVTAAQFGNILDVISGQTQSITGGNTELLPESSDTYTFGFVYTPSVVPGLSITVDYFDISVDGFIAAGIGAQTILDRCLATGLSAFCDLITRGPSGTLAAAPGVGFQATNINIAEVNTAGIDGQVLYRTNIGNAGRLLFNYAGTYLSENDFVPFPGGDPIDCAGFADNSCIQPVNPEYRHIASVTWEANFNLDTTITWRYFSGTKNEPVAANPRIDADLPSISYIDLSFFYELNDGINLRAGVLNVFDEVPPIATLSGPPLGNGNTFPTIYDTARTFFGGVNFKF